MMIAIELKAYSYTLVWLVRLMYALYTLEHTLNGFRKITGRSHPLKLYYKVCIPCEIGYIRLLNF